MKKLLALALVLLMALSCTAFASENAGLANTDPNSILAANELVELSLLMRGDSAKIAKDDFWFFQFCEKFMNVKFNAEAVDSSVFYEKLNIIMSTDSMPDMVMASATIWQNDMMTWGQLDGMFLPIDQYAEYCPKYMAEIQKQPRLVNVVTTPNGHMYGFSNIRVVNEGQSMGIFTVTNTEWLERLGMDMPTTLDEFYDMLIAFRDEDANGDGDPNNEIPWQASYNSGYPERIFVNWAFGYNGYRWDEVDSTTHEGYFSPYTPRYREVIEFMAKCYQEGLIQTTKAEGVEGSTFMSGDNGSNTAFGQTNTDYTYYGFSVDVGREQLTGNKDCTAATPLRSRSSLMTPSPVPLGWASRSTCSPGPSAPRPSTPKFASSSATPGMIPTWLCCMLGAPSTAPSTTCSATAGSTMLRSSPSPIRPMLTT